MLSYTLDMPPAVDINLHGVALRLISLLLPVFFNGETHASHPVG
jgi:hypothetical protein